MSPTDDQIAAAQRHFALRFPQDYLDFLATRGAMSEFVPPADDFLMIYSPAELIDINEAGEFQKRFPGAVVIGGDGSRELLAYDFRQDPPLLR
ncbi:SMI1/KNR4 family protein [Streptomyces sp. NPDC057137]|uniref:SMI1/KNR4 family protein n=1 Tax=Streptomyces sp. NPDC057137 TaxID=3346030 RepID=UPI00363E387A